MMKRSGTEQTPAQRLIVSAWVLAGLCGYNLLNGDRIWAGLTAVGAVISAVIAIVLKQRAPRA